MSGCWQRVRQVRRTGCLQIGDRRSDAGCVVFEKSHTPIAFVAKEPADQAGCVTVIHAKGARRLLFTDGARAVLLCQESVVFLQRNPKMVLETQAAPRPARLLKPSFVKLRISRVPVPLAGVNLSLVGLVIGATLFKHSRTIFRIFCVSGLIDYGHLSTPLKKRFAGWPFMGASRWCVRSSRASGRRHKR
jgi:hypothetical protein